jgi:hypothetical protein
MIANLEKARDEDPDGWDQPSLPRKRKAHGMRAARALQTCHTTKRTHRVASLFSMDELYMQAFMPFAARFAGGFVFGKRTHREGVFEAGRGGFGRFFPVFALLPPSRNRYSEAARLRFASTRHFSLRAKNGGGRKPGHTPQFPTAVSWRRIDLMKSLSSAQTRRLIGD